MSKKQPTASMNSDGPWQQTHDETQPTAANGSPFQPTNPPQQPKPPGPVPFAPEAVDVARHTVVVDDEQAPIPLAWLVVFAGQGGPRGHIHPLEREIIVGRTAGDLTLDDDPAVSGQHLKIKLEATDEEEVFVLYDMASSNGTYVGDRETYQQDENRVYRHVLKDGDFILVGQTTLVFKQV